MLIWNTRLLKLMHQSHKLLVLNHLPKCLITTDLALESNQREQTTRWPLIQGQIKWLLFRHLEWRINLTLLLWIQEEEKPLLPNQLLKESRRIVLIWQCIQMHRLEILRALKKLHQDISLLGFRRSSCRWDRAPNSHKVYLVTLSWYLIMPK